MENKGVKICMIILLIIVAIILISIMVIEIIEQDKPHKTSFLGIGDNTELIFENEYSINEIENITINASSHNVKFNEGNSDKVKVTIYGAKDDIFDVKQNEKNLNISKESHNFYIFALFYLCREEIIVEVPKDYKRNIEIDTQSGNVEVASFEDINLKINSNSGNVKCGNINSAKICTTSGNIDAGDILEKGILSAKSGNIRAGNITERSFNYNIRKY